MPVKTIPVGTVFGKLTVLGKAEPMISISGKKRQKRSRSLCLCKCGKTITTLNQNLFGNETRSCGCLATELMIARATHGQTRVGKITKTYVMWRNMHGRCYNPSRKCFPDYGGRGISVCERWHKFENFYEDMGECPPGLTLERKNNSLGYSKENCVWASRTQQNRNKRDNIVITFDGITAVLSEHCERIGINYITVRQRIRMLGWDYNRALSTPVQKRTNRSDKNPPAEGAC